MRAHRWDGRWRAPNSVIHWTGLFSNTRVSAECGELVARLVKGLDFDTPPPYILEPTNVPVTCLACLAGVLLHTR